MASQSVAVFGLLSLAFTLAHAGGPNCGPAVFQRIQSCCDAPMTMKKEVFDSCRPEKSSMNSSLDGKGERPPKPTPYQTMCLFECALKNQNMISSNGAINYKVLTPSFIKSVNSTWAARTRLAINACAPIVAKFNAKSIAAPTNGEALCNPKPAIFMSCLRQKMLVSCATSGEGNNCDSAALEKLQKAEAVNLVMKPDSV